MAIMILLKFDTCIAPVNDIIIGDINIFYILLFLLLLIVLLTGFFALLSLVFGIASCIWVTSQ